MVICIEFEVFAYNNTTDYKYLIETEAPDINKEDFTRNQRNLSNLRKIVKNRIYKQVIVFTIALQILMLLGIKVFSLKENDVLVTV